MLNKSIAILIALFALVLGTGCGGVHLFDDIDLELDFELTPSDDLHLPYVVGTKVRISASDGRTSDDESRWTLASSNAAVLSVDSQSHGSAQCTAQGAGTATIMVYDEDGDLIHESEIEVAKPNRVQLIPHGPLIIGRGGAVDDIRMLQGGTATYLVRYLRNDERLYGNGVLTPKGGELASARNETTFLFENREWLQIDAVTEGTSTIGLSVGGLHLANVPLTVVGLEAVASLELLDDERQDEPEHGDLRTVLALGRDSQALPIYGIEVSWDLDGDGVAGTGDLFRYEYNADVTKVLGAEFGEQRDEIPIHALTGYTDSSNNLGCTLSKRRQDKLPAMALLMASIAAVFCLRRRQDP